jgi:hypothetical protein
MSEVLPFPAESVIPGQEAIERFITDSFGILGKERPSSTELLAGKHSVPVSGRYPHDVYDRGSEDVYSIQVGVAKDDLDCHMRALEPLGDSIWREVGLFVVMYSIDGSCVMAGVTNMRDHSIVSVDSVKPDPISRFDAGNPIDMISVIPNQKWWNLTKLDGVRRPNLIMRGSDGKTVFGRTAFGNHLVDVISGVLLEGREEVVDLQDRKK